MVRYAKPNEKQCILDIFNICFPGEERFADWFFGNVFDHINTLVYEKDEKIVATLQMIPVKLQENSETYNSVYMYGVATLPKYRGGGIMDKVLTFAHHECISNGVDYAILITQNDSLFDYYKKYGYHICFDIYTHTVAPALDKNISLLKMNKSHIEGIDKIYSAALSNQLHALRDTEHYGKMLELFGDTAMVNLDENGTVKAYAFSSIEDQGLVISEGGGLGFESFAQSLCKHFSQNKCEYKTYLPMGEKQPLGMLKPLCKNGENLPVGYINLLFN